MKNLFHILCITVTLLLSLDAAAQADRRQVRAGNRAFRREHWQQADIRYRKALMEDSTSFAAHYNLANTMYRQEDYDGAGKQLEALKEPAAVSPHGADYYYNLGDVALQKKDYKAAVDAFTQSLLRNPGDLEAKENYIYAKLMLENQQDGGGGGGQDQNQDQNQNQNQNQDQQNQDQDQDQNQNQNQDQQNQDQQQDQGQGDGRQMTSQQAQQLLQAIQAKEKETQEKVNKEKALMLKSRQKEKNW